MTQTSNKTLITALIRILKPLVRVLLRNGISYGAFSDIAKKTYVDIAESEYALPGKKQTVSRVSVLTGLSRKEVKRVKELPEMDDKALDEKYNRAARVISGWLRDKNYQKDGTPADLAIEGECSFSSLVKTYSGDIPVKAILDELVRVGSVVIRQGNVVSLVTHGYVPGDSEEEKLNILGTDVSDLIETIDFNISQKEASRYQRKVSYDNLPVEAIDAFRELSAKHSQRLLEELNDWLAENDRDTNKAIKGTGKVRAGVGIYYFEEDQSQREDS